MNMRSLVFSPFGRSLCLLLAVSMALGPSTAVFAQTNAAAQAVRQRVQGLSGEAPPADAPPPRDDRDNGEFTPSAPVAGGIDTSYVTPNAVVVIAVRPAQLLAAPIAQMFPVEIVSASGLKYLGFDPAEMEEVIAFAEMPSGESPAPAYGAAIKFTKPFRGAAIPAALRAHAGPGELAGRKYLQSRDPMKPSLFAPDNKTLLVGPDNALRQVVETKDQAKSGAVVARVHAAPPGSDLYAAVDVAALRPLMAMGLMQAAQQLPPGAPPEVQQLFEIPNLVAAAELTFNVSGTGPMSLVVHANDEAAAERLEQIIDTVMKASEEQRIAQVSQQPMGDDPLQQSLDKYTERLSAQLAASFQRVREGSQLKYVSSGDADPIKQQQTHLAVIGLVVAKLIPLVQVARNMYASTPAPGGREVAPAPQPEG